MNESSEEEKPARPRIFQCSKVKKADYKPKLRSTANEFDMNEEEQDETSIHDEAKEQEDPPTTSSAHEVEDG